MIEQLKLDHNGFMSTLNIANRYGKNHYNVLRDIEKIIKEYNTLSIERKSESSSKPAVSCTYEDSSGKKNTYYLLANQQRTAK